MNKNSNSLVSDSVISFLETKFGNDLTVKSWFEELFSAKILMFFYSNDRGKEKLEISTSKGYHTVLFSKKRIDLSSVFSCDYENYGFGFLTINKSKRIENDNVIYAVYQAFEIGDKSVVLNSETVKNNSKIVNCSDEILSFVGNDVSVYSRKVDYISEKCDHMFLSDKKPVVITHDIYERASTRVNIGSFITNPSAALETVNALQNLDNVSFSKALK